MDDFSDLIIRQNANGDAVVFLDGVAGPGTDAVTLIGISAASLSSENFFFDF